MKRKFYHILPTFNGIRIDSGVDHSDFFSALNTEMKRGDNNVVKLTNLNNILNENVKFTKAKKQKTKKV